ncbi:MAG: glycosyltransferase family 4 protein [Bacteroidia bacterium]|nr:glycosyltransferase family 4 protein [Bacteroidia bacterium]
MKILVIGSRVPYPLKDGGAIAAYTHLKGFAEAGEDVSFYSLNTLKHFVDNKTLLEKFSFLHQIHTFKIDTSLKPLDAILNLFSNESYNIIRFYNKLFEDNLVKYIKENNFDIIQFEGLFASMYVKEISKVSKAKLVLRQHNVEHNIWGGLALTEKNSLKKWYLKLIYNRIKKYEIEILPHFDAIIAITEEDKIVFKKYTEKPVFTSKAGIDINVISNNKPSSKVYHIGSMEWLPNLEGVNWLLTEVWPLVENKIPDAQLFIAGKMMPEEIYKYQSNTVKIMGEVPDAAEFISDKGIMVVPLKSGSGIRMKTLEAMAAGKAVVTTSTGLQGINAQNKEDVFVADIANDFAENILMLIENQNLREATALKANHFVNKNFNNTILIKDLLKFYITIKN